MNINDLKKHLDKNTVKITYYGSELFQDYSSHTSIHGYNYIYTNKYIAFDFLINLGMDFEVSYYSKNDIYHRYFVENEIVTYLNRSQMSLNSMFNDTKNFVISKKNIDSYNAYLLIRDLT